MKSHTDQIKESLNKLLVRNMDAQEGYKSAAENVDNTSFKNYFQQKSEDRKFFNEQLKREIKSYNVEPDPHTSLQGDIHRTWIDTKGLVQMNDPEHILDEVIRGEEKALEDFNEVLENKSLLKPTVDLLQEQKATIKASLNKANIMDSLTVHSK